MFPVTGTSMIVCHAEKPFNDHIVKEVSDIDDTRLVFYGDEGSSPTEPR